jgi:hypothetical protein
MDNRLKWAAVTAGLTLSLIGLSTACSGPEAANEPAPTSGTFQVTQVEVEGKKVTCVTWADYKKGGLSCNWEPFNRK